MHACTYASPCRTVSSKTRASKCGGGARERRSNHTPQGQNSLSHTRPVGQHSAHVGVGVASICKAGSLGLQHAAPAAAERESLPSYTCLRRNERECQPGANGLGATFHSPFRDIPSFRASMAQQLQSIRAVPFRVASSPAVHTGRDTAVPSSVAIFVNSRASTRNYGRL